MTDHPAQFPLDLRLAPQFGAADFLVGPSNARAIELIEAWPHWTSRLQLIVGPAQCGKSHLLSIWLDRAREDCGSRTAMVSAELLASGSPVALAAHEAIAVDVDEGGVAEAPFFHFINSARETNAFVVIAARKRPDQWGLRTADLLSRLRLAPVTEISAPDDTLLRAVMVKHFVDRQIIVDTSVVEFLLARIERSFAGVAGIVNALDIETLALGRRLTRPLAARVLERLDSERLSSV